MKFIHLFKSTDHLTTFLGIGVFLSLKLYRGNKKNKNDELCFNLQVQRGFKPSLSFLVNNNLADLGILGQSSQNDEGSWVLTSYIQ